MDFSVNIPFVSLLGFELQRMADGHAEITYAPAPEHLNSFGVVHGGVTMTLLDVTMAHAARSVADILETLPGAHELQRLDEAW
jgi:uncharacterized protein (TIGR00369 family)